MKAPAALIVDHFGQGNLVYQTPICQEWKVRKGLVDPILYFPASGDCSYPGMLVDPNGDLCISYYSQHAYGMGVVPSTTGIEPADIFFAKIDLS